MALSHFIISNNIHLPFLHAVPLITTVPFLQRLVKVTGLATETDHDRNRNRRPAENSYSASIYHLLFLANLSIVELV